MKIRNGFVSNSSSSSYILLVAEFAKNPTNEILEKAKELNCLYEYVNSREPKYLFGKQFYDCGDDYFYPTDFNQVEQNRLAIIELYNQIKDEFKLGELKYAGTVSYGGEANFIDNVAEREHMEKIDQEAREKLNKK